MIVDQNLIRNSKKITAFQYQFHKMRYLKMNGARYVMGLTRIDFHGVTAVPRKKTYAKGTPIPKLLYARYFQGKRAAKNLSNDDFKRL